MELSQYIRDVAKAVSERYNKSYYEALNVAESIINQTGYFDYDVSRVYLIIQGEL